MTLHPHNLAQKAEIIVEHFREHTRAEDRRQGEGDGRHVSSRLHAVRYKLAHRHVHRRARATRTCTRSSRSPGTVIDDGRRVHRAGDERLPRERRRPTRSTSDEYQVLVVAEKFQTGFDQPLLHTMYVDKMLDGLARGADALAAQPHPPGQDGHVRPRLPQRRRGRSRRRSSPYYERDRRDPDRPEPLYDTRRTLDDFDVLREDEVEAGVPALARSATETTDHGTVYALLDPARRALQGARRGGAGRVPRRARRASSTSTRSSPRSSRSATARSSATTSTRARSSTLLPGQAAERPRPRQRGRADAPPARADVRGVGLARPRRGRGARDLRRPRARSTSPRPSTSRRSSRSSTSGSGSTSTDADQLLFDQFEETWAADESSPRRRTENDLDNFRLVFDRSS